MRVISLRCDGLISAVKQGLIEWIVSKDADIICLQDVRVREYKVMGDSRFCPEGFEAFYFEGEDEDQGGVAIFTRHTPKAVMRGLGSYDLDRDGRYIQADFEHVNVVSLLPPSPTADSKELRAAFLESLETWMRKIRKNDVILSSAVTLVWPLVPSILKSGINTMNRLDLQRRSALDRHASQ